MSTESSRAGYGCLNLDAYRMNGRFDCAKGFAGKRFSVVHRNAVIRVYDEADM